MKPAGDVEVLESVVTDKGAREPGRATVTGHFSTSRGYEIVRTGGIIRVSKDGAVTGIPMSNVIDFKPAP